MTPTPPALDLEEMEAKEKAATPGPWKIVTPWPDMPEFTRLSAIDGPKHVNAHDDYSVADTAFIAASRTFVPAAIAELKAARAEVAVLRKVIEGAIEWRKRGYARVALDELEHTFSLVDTRVRAALAADPTVPR